MLCSMKSAVNRRRYVSELGYMKRHYRANKPQRSNLLKVSVVGSGSFGEPSSLFIRTCDNFIKLFNCGEGTFRLLYSKSHRFRYFGNVFCTSNRWERVGGIPSLARAAYDRTSQFPIFHGPPQIESLLRRFAQMTDLDPDMVVTGRQFNHDPFFEDAYSQIDFVNLHRDKNPSDEESVIAYFCRLRPRKGNVILSKFTENNVPIEHIHTISSGKDVRLDNGTIYLAKDYLAPGFTGASFLIIDVPSQEYLADLERNELLNGNIDEINSNLGMEFVGHFTPSNLIETPEYQKFMRKTNARRHLAINDINMLSGLKHVHSMQKTLNHLDADIYPHLSSKYTASRQTFTNMKECIPDIYTKEPVEISPAPSGTRYIFSLNGRISDKEFERAAYDDEDEETDSSTEDLESDEENELHTTTLRSNAFPKIVFFGTGSSFPGITKNATSILVHTSPDTSILLDCGEGTVGQMCRFYGSRTEDVIKSIKALHITHMHGDHHMGLMDLVRIRQKYMPVERPPLLLMSPQLPFESLLNFYETHFGDVLNEFKMINNEDLINGGLTDDQKSLLKIKDLQTCRVPHLDPSYAISIKTNVLPTGERQEEFKLTFSGDTLPCDALVELGRDSTLLIHEATLEDTLANSAAQKKHSTISQAIGQGDKMHAKHTILTHFSQRYRVLPPINDELIRNKNVGIAFDNMEIIPDDLHKLNGLYFKLKETYANELRKVEERSKKYALRNDFSMIE